VINVTFTDPQRSFKCLFGFKSILFPIFHWNRVTFCFYVHHDTGNDNKSFETLDPTIKTVTGCSECEQVLDRRFQFWPR